MDESRIPKDARESRRADRCLAARAVHSGFLHIVVTDPAKKPCAC
jgi:hypothetical protein